MKRLIRRAATLLLLFCLASPVMADSPHPHIAKSQVIKLDVAAIERNAKSKTPIELVFGDTRLTVTLAPSGLWPKEGLTILEFDRGVMTSRTVTDDPTYAGEVVGEDPAESEARFTIARGVLQGYVLSRSGWWFVEPLARFDPKASRDQYLVYATHDLDFALHFGGDTAMADTVYEPRPTVDKRPTMMMVADRLYVDRNGPWFHEDQAALLNAVNGIYKDQIGQEFRMTLSIADFGGDWLTSRCATLLLQQLEEFIRFAGACDPLNTSCNGLTGLGAADANLVHLTTAKHLEDDIGGIAYPDHFLSVSQQQVVPTGDGGSIDSIDWQDQIRAAHEIGHNLNGSHEEAERWCVEFSSFGCRRTAETIMYETVWPTNTGRFSDGSRHNWRNNREDILETMIDRRWMPWQ